MKTFKTLLVVITIFSTVVNAQFFQPAHQAVRVFEENWTNNNWEKSSDSYYQYNNRDHVVQDSINMTWVSGSWMTIFANKYEREYNSNDLPDVLTAQTLTNGNWTNSYKTTFEYNGQNLPVHTLSQEWKNNDWINNSETFTEYNERGHVIKDSSFIMWNNNQWEQSSLFRYEYEYGSNDSIITMLTQFYQEEEWKNSTKCSFQYNGANRKSYHFQLEWEPNMNDWIPSREHFYRYNDNGDIIFDSSNSYWNGESWSIVSVMEYEYEYNSDGKPIEEIIYMTDYTGVLAKFQRKTYEYGENVSIFESNEKNIKSNDLAIANYPNPFNCNTIIAFSLDEADSISITIYNSLGMKVKEFPSTAYQAGRHQIAWNSKDTFGKEVGAGVYFYMISSSTEKKTGKMILLK